MSDAPTNQPTHGDAMQSQSVQGQQQPLQGNPFVQGPSNLGQGGMTAQGLSKAPGSTRGSKWTAEQEAWLVVNTMSEVTVDWLTSNFPDRARGQNAISGHIADMKLKGRLSRSWRAKSWGNEDDYTLNEDVEIIQWHVWGREYIDAQVFVAKDRAGGSVLQRADYLCQDKVLVEAVTDIEERVRKFTLAHDRYLYGDMETTVSSIRLMAMELRETETNSVNFVKDALIKSMARRGARPYSG